MAYNSGLMYIHRKSVSFTCSSRSTRASQSLQLVEKQPKSTPDMYKPTSPSIGRGVFITYPHGHSLWLLRPVVEFCEDSVESQTTLINVFYVFIYSFFLLLSSALQFPVGSDGLHSYPQAGIYIIRQSIGEYVIRMP